MIRHLLSKPVDFYLHIILHIPSNLHKALSIIVCGYPIPVKGIHKIRMHYMVFPFISLVRFPAGSQPPDQYIHIKQLHLLMLKKQKLLLFEGICRKQPAISFCFSNHEFHFPGAYAFIHCISAGNRLFRSYRFHSRYSKRFRMKVGIISALCYSNL